jgi:hypothetical protein
VRAPARCGTNSGYFRHRRLDEPICQPCRDAHNSYRVSIRPKNPRPLAPCGTVSAYARHRKRGEQPCQPCKDAANAEQKARRAANPQHVAQHRRYIAARGRALSRLAEAHPEEMAAFLAEELGPDDIAVRKPTKWTAA